MCKFVGDIEIKLVIGNESEKKLVIPASKILCLYKLELHKEELNGPYLVINVALLASDPLLLQMPIMRGENNING